MDHNPTVAYLDCFSGISGDMLLGALIDCGLDRQLLEHELAKLSLDAWHLDITRQPRQGIASTAVSVVAGGGRSLRTLPDIRAILTQSSLDSEIIEQSLAVFEKLGAAEAHVHDRPIDQIHFHEIGALDTIIDIVGSIIGLRQLGITRLCCSPLPLGRGFVDCAHGRFPLPAPAVCALLTDVPVIGCDAARELVTPTGAALAVSLADSFGPLPAMRIRTTGYGAGQAAGEAGRPNLLRLFIGTPITVSESGSVEVIETHLDDWQSEGFPLLCERLFAARALDVSLTPLQMKKGRPGYCLRVIVDEAYGPKIREMILTETSSIGLRYRVDNRVTLPRRTIVLNTRWGEIAAKEVDTPRGTKVYPEYESCRVVAELHGIPLDLVYREIIALSEQER